MFPVAAGPTTQAGHHGTPIPATAQGPHPSVPPASLRTDLAIARAEIRRLRADHDKLRNRLRLHLGAEIEGPERAELIARVAALEDCNRQLVAERHTRAP